MIIRDAVEADLPTIVEIYNATVPTHMVTAELEIISISRLRTLGIFSWSRTTRWRPARSRGDGPTLSSTIVLVLVVVLVLEINPQRTSTMRTRTRTSRRLNDENVF